MNKQEFVKELEKIEIVYNKTFTQKEYKLWFEEFQNISKEEFGNAINKIITTHKYVPKIVDIKKKINENTHIYYTNEPYTHLYKNLEWGKFANKGEL